MPKVAFIFLRILTAVASLGALAGTLLVIFLKGALTFVKEGAHVVFSVAKIFASGFQKSSPTPPHEHVLTLPLASFVLLFTAMFVSVFTPNQKIFLHIIAAMAIAAASWRIWIMIHTSNNQLVYLPVIALWFLYYAVCLLRR